MTVTESKGLEKGSGVYWRCDATDSGRITETSWDAVTIAWDNGQVAKGGNRRATSWRRIMRVKIFDLSWNVDLNRLENEINAFLAMLPSNAVKHVQSAASSTRTGDTDQMQTDYLVTVWYEGEPKKPAVKKSARR